MVQGSLNLQSQGVVELARDYPYKEEVMKFKSSILPPLGPELIKKKDSLAHERMEGDVVG